MRFGPLPLDQALGTVLAHTQVAGGRRIGKGQRLTEADLAALSAAGIDRMVVAALEPGDVGEDESALALAQALVPDGGGLSLTAPHAGRVNLIATGPGVVGIDTAAIHALNRIDPALTLATLPPFARVGAGVLVATVKIITYAVPGDVLTRGIAVARAAIRVRPVVLGSAGLILTRAGGAEDKLAAKGREAVSARLARLGMRLDEVMRVPHEPRAIADAVQRIGGDMVLILTGAATSDLHDTAPEALRLAGGRVARFGMPVDPGNLLFLGALGTRPVIGLPGCARSPALNGADWVLERIACGLAVSDDDIAGMGVGGLLKEIPIRPQPRERRQE